MRIIAITLFKSFTVSRYVMDGDEKKNLKNLKKKLKI